MTDIIMEYEGTLDKYIGDAIMAIYGAPEEQDDHAIRACRTAFRMMEILNEEREKWVKEGLPTLWIGIGINTGQMVVGNMGSERRFDFTVMGDNVNLASRLEGLSKFYGVNILVSEFTQKKAKDHFVFRELDFVRVKGKERPVRIFELFGKDYFTQGRYAFISPFKNGLEAYRKQDWDKAIRLFEEVLYLKARDNPATLFMKRCQTLKRMPPPKDWDRGLYSKGKVSNNFRIQDTGYRMSTSNPPLLNCSMKVT